MPQSFILRLEVGGQLRPLGLPLESLTPEYGAEVRQGRGWVRRRTWVM